MVTPIHAVLTAKTWHLDPCTKEGVELLHFLPYIIGSKTKCACSQWSLIDLQYGQMPKSHFAVQSSNQVVKVTVKIS